MDILEGLIYVIWRGIAIGVIISAPMGPVGILCVQRTLEKGRSIGFFTGIGAALSDLFYCLLTGFGLSFIEDFLTNNQNVIQMVGSVVLVLFGIYLFRSNPARTLKKPDEQRPSKGKNILSGFLFTFSNPLIIFLIIGLFARFNFLLPELTAAYYMAGYAFIFLGALLWWWIVTFFIDKVRSHFNLRSMWLVNKITGVIIMIFALVGIVTAVSGLAKAATPAPLYLNGSRGFGPLSGEGTRAEVSPLVINAGSAGGAERFLPTRGADDFALTFRAAHRGPGEWGIVLRGDDDSRISFATLDDRFDALSTVSMRIRLDNPQLQDLEKSLDTGVGFHDEWNSLRLVRRDGCLSLAVGNRRYQPVFSGIPVSASDSVGFWVAPGGSLMLDDIVMEPLAMSPDSGGGANSHFADADVRRSYFARSSDPVEGVWEFFDRSLEETLLRPGGSYRLAVVASSGGYELVYLGGARVMADKWEAGMCKGRLKRTAFRDIYDVEWLDPSGCRLRGDIKAQFEEPDILLIQFPEHGSSRVRMRKIDYDDRSGK